MNDLSSFDQQVTLALNGSHSLLLDNAAMIETTTIAYLLPMLCLFYIIFKNKSRKESLIIFLTIAVMLFVADRICSGYVKPTVARWRPARDPEIMYLVDTVLNYRGGRFGFFSGHSCNSFCVATFLALLFRSWRMTLTLFFFAALHAFNRVYLGVHYLGDITVGFFVGLLIGIIFYLIYNRIQIRFQSTRLISEQFTSSGFLHSDIDIFLTVVFLNYILILLFSLTRGII